MSIIYRKTVPRSERRRITQTIERERAAEPPRLLIQPEETDARQAREELAYARDEAKLVRDLEEIVRRSDKLETFVPFLPGFFNLNGDPYTLQNHFVFEPFYYQVQRRRVVYKTGRQVAKSTNQAVQGVLISNLVPYFNTLFVTPLFEMVRRFSSNYVRPVIEESNMRDLFMDQHCNNSVLQRSFRNRSIMYFSYAFLNADRTRGINAAKLVIDEAQDMDGDLIPIISETMSASPWNITQITGTPKTLDGTLEQQWSNSSKGEWAIPCGHCHKTNIPSMAEDLDAMLGPHVVEREISEHFPAVVCAKCGKPLNPREGFYLHHSGEARLKSDGYHIPQIVLPMHYANAEKWSILQGKRQGFGRTPINVFYNEVCGESYDTGAKLLTDTDLQKASSRRPNTIAAARAVMGNYTKRILAVDWGGGGEDEISFTTAAVLGEKPNGKIDCLFGWRSLTPHAHMREAVLVLKLMKALECQYLVHDFSGAGELRDTYLHHAGLPPDAVLPVSYNRVGQGAMVVRKPFNDRTGKKSYYQMDKSRSLQFTCEMVKLQYIEFFEYDYHGESDAGLLRDFLSLVEDRVDSRHAGDIYTIIRNSMVGPDDFAQAVNIGCNMIFYLRGKWPDIARLTGMSIDRDLLARMMADTNRMTDWQ